MTNCKSKTRRIQRLGQNEGGGEGGDLVTWCACRMVYLANSLQLKSEKASIVIIMVFKFEAFLRTVVLRHMLMNLTYWSMIYDDFMLYMVTLINFNNSPHKIQWSRKECRYKHELHGENQQTIRNQWQLVRRNVNRILQSQCAALVSPQYLHNHPGDLHSGYAWL